MVRSRTSTARSRLHESISAFVPLFLSNRSASAVPPAHYHPELDNKFEYIGSSEASGRYDEKPEEPKSAPLPSHPQHKRTMNPPPLSRSQTSSSTGSNSSSTKRHNHKRSHQTRTRTRPAPSRTATPSTTRSKPRTVRTRPRRKITAFTRLRLAVESKFRLSLAFGLGFVSSLVLYLGLFLSKTSSGTTFHVLSILLLVIMLAIFVHSLLRFLALNRELKDARAHRAGLKKTPSARGWNISRPLPQFTSSSSIVHDEKAAANHHDGIGTAHGGYENDDFPVFNAASVRNYNTDYEHNPYDQDIEANAADTHHSVPVPVAYPPPVYGNTRNSVRLSLAPSNHHHQSADPNITAPAPTLAPGMPGWHPPSFRSEGGITAVLERRRMEVQDRLRGTNHGGGEVLGTRKYDGGMI